MHATIEAFRAGAELLDVQESSAGLDDVIAELAAWMDLASERLSEDDLVVLNGIGAMLFRTGLRNRQ